LIPVSEPDLGKLEKEYLNQAYDSGWIGSKGDFLDRFESEFSKFIGVKYAVTCSSGTAALQLAYIACGMNAHTRVIVPKNTFVATKNMAMLTSGSVEEVDGDPESWNIHPKHDMQAEYVVGVHLYGVPCDMGQLYRCKFKFIEDCAQSLGSKYRNKRVGSFGFASIFSFHSSKMLACGEGGMVCTNDEKVAKSVRHLKNQAMLEPYVHQGIGFNLRMTNLQASIGLAQLHRIDELMAKKRWITKFYHENLDKSFVRQKESWQMWSVKWGNTFRHPEAKKKRGVLSQNGIETRPGFIGDDFIMLPSATTLTKTDLERIVSAANAS
jgi:perosamine synthetase